jgi:hypothetical protein
MRQLHSRQPRGPAATARPFAADSRRRSCVRSLVVPLSRSAARRCASTKLRPVPYRAWDSPYRAWDSIELQHLFLSCDRDAGKVGEQRKDDGTILKRSQRQLADDHRVYANLGFFKQRDQGRLGPVQMVDPDRSIDEDHARGRCREQMTRSGQCSRAWQGAASFRA